MSPSNAFLILSIIVSVHLAEMSYDTTFREAYEEALKESRAQDDRTYEEEDIDALSKRERSSPIAHLHYANEGLMEHNKKRAIHNAPDMVGDNTLVAEATVYANELASQNVLALKHDTHRGATVGENLYVRCTTSSHVATAKQATNAWYNEVCFPGFDFSKNEYSRGTGHFSQVVWKSSIKLGIGFATMTFKKKFLCTFVVARYSPSGNYPNSFSANVEKGQFSKSSCPSNAELQVDSKDARTHEFTDSNKREMAAYESAVNRLN